MDTGKIVIPIFIMNDTSFFSGYHSRRAVFLLSSLFLVVVNLIKKALQYP